MMCALSVCVLVASISGCKPKQSKAERLERQLSAAVTTGDMTAITRAVDQLISGLEPKAVVPLLQPVITSMIGSEKFTQASEIIARLASHKKGTAQEYKDLVATSNLKNLIAQKDWQKMPGAFETCAAQLKDDVLLALMRQTFTTLQKNQQVALLEDICKNVFLIAASKKTSANYAARIWVDIGMLANKRVLPERLVTLLDAKVQAEQVAMLFERYFYEFVEAPDIIKTLCVIGERITGECSDEETKNSLKIKLLDGAFITENYDLALKMLEGGIPDKPPEWHAMSIPKVKAHRALVQNKPQEAIGFFREFMQVMTDKGPDEEHDPTTGVAYSKEWILGRNAHRIATLYDSISDTTNAAKAREEAKAYLAAAYPKAEKDADTLNPFQAYLNERGFLTNPFWEGACLHAPRRVRTPALH
jgi:hypothetical protein